MAEVRLRRISEDWSFATGNLSEYPFSFILGKLHYQKTSGILHIQRQETHYKIIFFNGAPVYVESGPPRLFLGNLLMHLKKISRKEYEQTETLRQKTGKMMGEVLVKTKILTRRELQKSLELQMKFKLIDCLKPKQGVYYFIDEAIQPESEKFYLLRPENILWEGVKRFYPGDFIKFRFPVNWDSLSVEPDQQLKTGLPISG